MSIFIQCLNKQTNERTSEKSIYLSSLFYDLFIVFASRCHKWKPEISSNGKFEQTINNIAIIHARICENYK